MSAYKRNDTPRVGASANSARVPADRWYDHVNWWEDPRLAYAAGLAMGHAAGWRDGYAACNNELLAGLIRALGGPECKDYGDAVSIHHRQVDALRERQQWDRSVLDEREAA